jgi:hypothetical protein
MGFLADLGRSRVGTDLSDFLTARRNAELNKEMIQSNIQRANVLNEHTTEQIAFARNQRLEEEKKIAAGNKYRAIQPLLARFPVKKNQEYVLGLAKMRGWVNPDDTAKQKHVDEIQTILQQPYHVMVMGQNTVDAIQLEWDTISKAIENPEFAKENGIKGKPEELLQQKMAIGAKLDKAKGMLGAYINAYLSKLGTNFQAQGVGGAPKTRTVKQGKEIITQEWRDGEWVEVGRAPRSASGIKLKVGDVEFMQGDIGELSKGAETEVQKNIFKIDSALESVNQIISDYKPEYQTLGTRWESFITSSKEKLGMEVAAFDKQKLAEFSEYRKNAVATMNEEIRRLTGAQMSKAEAERLMKGMPNPGTGLFDGDSPTEFISAIKVMYRKLRMAKARHMWYLAQGRGKSAAEVKKIINSGDAISLESMRRIVNRIWYRVIT